MGSYTAIHFDGKLKRDIPDHVMETLIYMLDARATLETPISEVPFPRNKDGTSSPLSQCARWNCLFTMSSAYFREKTNSYMQQVGEEKYLHVVANLKNYNEEIEKFMKWILPFIEAKPGDWIGFELTDDGWDKKYIIDKEGEMVHTCNDIAVAPNSEYDPYSRGNTDEFEITYEWEQYVKENINPYVEQNEYIIYGRR